MRTGLTVSVIVHLVLIGWGVVSLRAFEPLDASNIESVPVEFITPDEVSNTPLGLKTAKVAEVSSPNDPTDVAAEKPVPAPEPPKADPVPPTPPPPPPPPPEPTPAPQPDTQAEAAPPPPPEPTPQPQEQAAPEQATSPEDTKQPEPDAPKPPEQPVQEARAEPPTPRVRPNRPAPPAKTEDFTDEISALLDKTKSAAAPAATEQDATIGAVTGSPFSRLQQNEIDALRARLASCWSIPPTAADPAELRVKVKMFLGRNGALERDPVIVEYRPGTIGQIAAESALRAVKLCAPYNLPAEKYDSWKEIIVTFDPREMFGG